MIEVKSGNMINYLFERGTGNFAPEFYVHGCNAQGAMGRGIAGEFRRRAPEVYEDYRRAYLLQGLQVGDVVSVHLRQFYDNNPIVFDAVTQEFYGADKNIVYVDYNGLAVAFRKINNAMTTWMDETSSEFDPVLNFPLIGAGLANGDWDIIEKIIDTEISNDFCKVLWVLPS